MAFDEVALALDLQPGNCRKLAARARAFIAEDNVRHIPGEARQSELLAAFQAALKTGNADGLADALRADANLRADSDGKVVAVRHVIEGPRHICRFISMVLSPAWNEMTLSVMTINGLLSVVVENEAGLHASVSFSYDPDGRVRHIFVMRHPDKLNLLTETCGMSARGEALWFN